MEPLPRLPVRLPLWFEPELLSHRIPDVVGETGVHTLAGVLEGVEATLRTAGRLAVVGFTAVVRLFVVGATTAFVPGVLANCCAVLDATRAAGATLPLDADRFRSNPMAPVAPPMMIPATNAADMAATYFILLMAIAQLSLIRARPFVSVEPIARSFKRRSPASFLTLLVGHQPLDIESPGAVEPEVPLQVPLPDCWDPDPSADVPRGDDVGLWRGFDVGTVVC